MSSPESPVPNVQIRWFDRSTAALVSLIFLCVGLSGCGALSFFYYPKEIKDRPAHELTLIRTFGNGFASFQIDDSKPGSMKLALDVYALPGKHTISDQFSYKGRFSASRFESKEQISNCDGDEFTVRCDGELGPVTFEKLSNSAMRITWKAELLASRIYAFSDDGTIISGPNPYIKEYLAEVDESKRAEAWSQLRIGMSIEEVDELIGLPPPYYTEMIEEWESFISLAKRVRAAGGNIDYTDRFCRYRGDDDCIVARTPEEGERMLTVIKEWSELNRYGEDYEFEFDAERQLRRWRQTGGEWNPSQ